MDIPDESDQTVRQQLTYIYEKTGVKPQLLNEEPKTSLSEGRFINMFWRIHSIKPATQPLVLSDIINWSAAYGTDLSPIELDYIFGLDMMVARELNKG